MSLKEQNRLLALPSGRRTLIESQKVRARKGVVKSFEALEFTGGALGTRLPFPDCSGAACLSCAGERP
jgi:hypothetical protein